MELTITEFDCTKFSLSELLNYVASVSPVHYNALGHAYKKLAAGGSAARVKEAIQESDSSLVFTILKYVVSEFRALQKTKITDVLPVASMMGATIDVVPLPCPSGLYLGLDEKPTPTDTAYFDAANPHLDAARFDKFTVEIVTEEALIVAPLFMGEPVVDAELQVACSEAFGMDVPTTNPREINVAHRIVDLFTYKKGKFLLKPIESCKAMRVLSADKDLKFYGLLLDKAFSIPFANGSQSAKGRDLLNRILVAMESARKLGSYDKTMGQLVDLFVKLAVRIQVPKSFGEQHKQGSLGYAYLFLEYSRGLRGGDDRDSTSIGLSSYLPYNVPRLFVRHMARIQDLLFLASSLDATKINLVGEGSEAYALSLSLLKKCPFKYVGFAGAAKLGLEVLSPGVYCQLGGVLQFGPIDPSACFVDVSLENVEKPWTVTTERYAQDEIVRLIKYPCDACTCQRFIPSTFPHRLVGWYLPEKYTGSAATVKQKEHNLYLDLSVRINKIRTLPSYFQQRAYDLLPANLKLNPSIMRIVTKQAISLDIEVESLQGENYGDLSSAYEAYKVAAGIENAIPKVEVASPAIGGGTVNDTEAEFEDDEEEVRAFNGLKIDNGVFG